VIGWLLDTNVVAELANPHGTARNVSTVLIQPGLEFRLG